MLCPAGAGLMEIDSSFPAELEKAVNTPVSAAELESLLEFAARACIQCELYPPRSKQAAALHPRLRPVCCSEYSPEVQMNILGLDARNLAGPVLDIGCGFTASLVRYLSGQDIEAYGFDRFVERESARVAEAAWSDYDYTVRSWATIISHMALSNHFRYAMHHDSALRKELESVYLRVLGSLARGGCFAYAPGEPELEALVDQERFSVMVTPVVSGFTAVKVRAVAWENVHSTLERV
jgi:hypothetical protein